MSLLSALCHFVRRFWLVLTAVSTLCAQTPQPSATMLPSSTSQAPLPTGGVLAKISPNDVLEVRVYQEPDLDARPRVSADGKINLPLIGEVSVGGMDASQAKDVIAVRYKKGYLVNPQVSVTVAERTKRRFTIMGQVQKPGAYYFPENESLSLLQAIAIAGGYTRIAKASNITVKRSVGGSERILEVNGKADAGGQGKSFMLQPNDIIQVGESLF